MEISFRHSSTSQVISDLIKEACKSLKEDTEAIESLVMLMGYSGKYHNLEHLKAMLENIQFLTPECCQPQVVLGVLLHDAKSTVKSTVKTYKSISKSPARNTIVDLIRATDHPVKKRLNTHWERVVHDADLAILGYPPPLFNIYEQQVRAEYERVPDELYYRERGEILKSLFISTDSVDRSLYQTEEFRDVYHRQSILNIDKALRHYEFKSKQNNSM